MTHRPYNTLAQEIQEIFQELEIDEIVKGLKENCSLCPEMSFHSCIICQEFKILKDEK